MIMKAYWQRNGHFKLSNIPYQK